MKSTLYAVIAACTSMLLTSGIFALATAAPPVRNRSPTVGLEAQAATELAAADPESYVGTLIDAELRQLEARRIRAR